MTSELVKSRPRSEPAPQRRPAYGRREVSTYFRRVSFIVPAIALLVVLTGYPLYQVVQMSLYDYSDAARPQFAALDNFGRLVGDAQFWVALVNTLVFTMGSVALAFVLGLALALLLDRPINGRFRGVFRSAFMIPWLFSSAAVSAIWSMMLEPSGVINHLLGLIGLDGMADTAWLGDQRTAMLSLIIANVWRSLPFVMLMLLAGLQTLAPELDEAAKLDGAGFPRRLFSVMLPQMRGVILTVVTLEIIWNFRTFDLIYIMTGGGPINSTEVLSTHVYRSAFQALDFGYASAAALFMLAVMLLVSVAYLRSSMSKERSGR